MPITFPSTAADITKVSATSGTSLAISKPTGTSDGDWLVMAYYARNGGATSLSVPAGWTTLLFNNYLWSYGIYGKYIPSAAAETATSYTCSTPAGTGRTMGMCLRLVGGSPTTLLDVAGLVSASPNGVVSNIVPGITTTKAYDALISVLTNTTASTTVSYFSPASGWTQLVQNECATATATSNMTLFTRNQTIAGDTGDATFPISPQSGNSLGQMTSLAPASTGTENVTGSLNIILRSP